MAQTLDGAIWTWRLTNFDRAKQITSLAAFPLQYSHEREAVRERLVARGRQYLSIVDKPTFFEYTGNGPTATSGIKEIVLSNG